MNDLSNCGGFHGAKCILGPIRAAVPHSSPAFSREKGNRAGAFQKSGRLCAHKVEPACAHRQARRIVADASLTKNKRKAGRRLAGCWRCKSLSLLFMCFGGTDFTLSHQHMNPIVVMNHVCRLLKCPKYRKTPLKWF